MRAFAPRVLLVLLALQTALLVCAATRAAERSATGNEADRVVVQQQQQQQEEEQEKKEKDQGAGVGTSGDGGEEDGAWGEVMGWAMAPEWMASTVRGAWAFTADAGAATQDMLTSSCAYYEDVVGPGTCEDLTYAVLASRDALHYWGRVLLAVMWALLVLLYENPIILAIVAGLFALYLAMRWMLRLAQRAVVLYQRFLAWVGRHLPIVATALPITAFALVWSYALTFPAVADALEWPLTAIFVARIWPLCMSIVTAVQLEDIAPAQPGDGNAPVRRRRPRNRRGLLGRLLTVDTHDHDQDVDEHPHHVDQPVFQSPHRRRLRVPAAHNRNNHDDDNDNGGTRARYGLAATPRGMLVRWLQYWVCFGVLTTLGRVPLLASTLYALTPYADVLYATLLVWLVVPLIHGTHVLYAALQAHVFAPAAGTAATRRLQRVLATYTAPIGAGLRLVTPRPIRPWLTAASALFTDTSVFVIALPALFSPRFMTRFAAALIAYGYPAYKTTRVLAEAHAATGGANGRGMGALGRQHTALLLGWLKYWVVLMVFEAAWALLTRATHDAVPLWWDLHIALLVILQLPALGAAAYLFDDFRVSPVFAVLRLGRVVTAVFGGLRALLTAPAAALRRGRGGDAGNRGDDGGAEDGGQDELVTRQQQQEQEEEGGNQWEQEQEARDTQGEQDGVG